MARPSPGCCKRRSACPPSSRDRCTRRSTASSRKSGRSICRRSSECASHEPVERQRQLGPQHEQVIAQLDPALVAALRQARSLTVRGALEEPPPRLPPRPATGRRRLPPACPPAPCTFATPGKDRARRAGRAAIRITTSGLNSADSTAATLCLFTRCGCGPWLLASQGERSAEPRKAEGD